MTNKRAAEILTDHIDCGECGLEFWTCKECEIAQALNMAISALEALDNTEKSLECVETVLDAEPRRKKPMILFSDRLKLAKYCREWIAKNEVNMEPSAVIAYLVNQELIDEEKFEKWKEEHNEQS